MRTQKPAKTNEGIKDFASGRHYTQADQLSNQPPRSHKHRKHTRNHNEPLRIIQRTQEQAITSAAQPKRVANAHRALQSARKLPQLTTVRRQQHIHRVQTAGHDRVTLQARECLVGAQYHVWKDEKMSAWQNEWRVQQAV